MFLTPSHATTFIRYHHHFTMSSIFSYFSYFAVLPVLCFSYFVYIFLRSFYSFLFIPRYKQILSYYTCQLLRFLYIQLYIVYIRFAYTSSSLSIIKPSFSM